MASGKGEEGEEGEKADRHSGRECACPAVCQWKYKSGETAQRDEKAYAHVTTAL